MLQFEFFIACVVSIFPDSPISLFSNSLFADRRIHAQHMTYDNSRANSPKHINIKRIIQKYTMTV